MGTEADLHTKLFLPPLCSCTECGKSNCLHQSEVFISLGWCRFGVTSGGSRKYRMGKFLYGISTEDTHIVKSDHCGDVEEMV